MIFFVVDNGFIVSFQAPNTRNMLFLHIIILSVVLYKENITLKSLPANVVSLKHTILVLDSIAHFAPIS